MPSWGGLYVSVYLQLHSPVYAIRIDHWVPIGRNEIGCVIPVDFCLPGYLYFINRATLLGGGTPH